MRQLLLLALALVLLLGVNANAETRQGQVSWVYDGDTLKVSGIGKVRLIGIDTPEKKATSRDHYYKRQFGLEPKSLRSIAHKALQFNIEQVKNRKVQLRFDVERTDKYGRTLAYVYLPDGRMLNRLLLEIGFATVYRRFDFRHKQDFLAAEAQARASRFGLWSGN